MKINYKTQIFDELERIAPSYFRKLKYDPSKDDYIVEIHNMSSYLKLMCTISDLLKLCIVATEEEGYVGSSITNLEASVNHTLELILQLLPMHEAEFLDQLQQYFGEEAEEEEVKETGEEVEAN